MKVIVGLDGSPATQPVMTAAHEVGRMLGAEVHGVHVRAESGEHTACAVAEAAGIPLDIVEGPPVERLVEAASPDDVVALTIGARRIPHGALPAGQTALRVAASLDKPIVIVPPDASHPERLRRILVPLEGTRSTTLAPKRMLQIAQGLDLEVVALHVHEESSLPAFSDQPQHELISWAEEFLARYAPLEGTRVSLETRFGRRAEQVLEVAADLDCDMIALGWAQELAPGRAPVVRSVLERVPIPLMLVPVVVADEGRVPPAGLASSSS